VQNKEPLFINEEIVNKFNQILKEELKKQLIKNWLYMYMPDHLHLIVEGETEKSNLWKAVVAFKQKTGYLLSKNGYSIQWQKDFYDHVHRKEEDLKKHIYYILTNPVRKGIVNKWEDYRFKGSFDFDLYEII